jgi:enoyl-CoA hydratase/carnithine racemase
VGETLKLSSIGEAGPSMTELLLTQIRGNIFEIVLNRPERRNAIHWPLMQALDAAIGAAEQAAGVRAVVVRGEGGGFSSGIDLAAFSELSAIFGDNWPARMLNVTAAFQSILNKFERCTLPTIAQLHGYALGLGFELALACDFRFAAAHTKLGLPETRLGLIPDVGGTTRLTRLIGPARAKELILPGKPIELAKAENWGVVNAVVPIDQLGDRVAAFVDEIAQAAPLAVSYAKRVIDGVAEIERGLQLEAWAQSRLIQSRDFQIGVQAAQDKTRPVWTGD